jgi:hypothetical protein
MGTFMRLFGLEGSRESARGLLTRDVGEKTADSTSSISVGSLLGAALALSAGTPLICYFDCFKLKLGVCACWSEFPLSFRNESSFALG